MVEAARRGRPRARLEALGYDNIEFRIGDGAAGWPRAGALRWHPRDRRGARRSRRALIEQLKPGGRLVIPLGRDPFSQELVLVEKDQPVASTSGALFPVAFVPLHRRRGAGP